MGLLDTLFGGSSEPSNEKTLPWQSLNNELQLNEIKERSKTRMQLIFKHSTRCGISRKVINQFKASYDLDLNADLYYLDLLNNRNLSHKIADRFEVKHESPQLLALKNGTVVAHASHNAITDLDLNRFA